jgi:hypothetical protein
MVSGSKGPDFESIHAQLCGVAGRPRGTADERCGPIIHLAALECLLGHVPMYYCTGGPLAIPVHSEEGK